MKKQVKVVAAIIENEQNEILCALRSPEMAIPNTWECPGGKVEKNEDLFYNLFFHAFVVTLRCIHCKHIYYDIL